MGMTDVEKAILWLDSFVKNKEPMTLIPKQLIMLIYDVLKEQDAETKRILKIIWDTLHEGLSIDTVPDQDWVYERIRNRIEGTYDET